ncbi:hypothetical protein SAMN04515656_12312 [Eubacterium aggregans]|uniref:Ig-like domain (Group 2) n=1 Tax=Eubacterium aggregans TaxID=81409 RepID=A0A1H4DED0_9FIRM|nr:hypothetical protein [Eubacterium aggregans]SEA70928.1 hypothetical protein SAMN04515656_12312 [Eubacterium aggregans]
MEDVQWGGKKGILQRSMRVLCLLLVGILLVSSGIAGVLASGASSGGTAIITVERQSLGQGFYLEPISVGFDAGEDGAAIVERALENKGEVLLEGSGIQSISGADTGSITIPEAVQALTTATLPTTGNTAAAGTLGSGAYTSGGHWALTLNGKSLESLWEYSPMDGDVLRIRYSLFDDEKDLALSKNAGDVDRILELVAQTDRSVAYNNTACSTALAALSKTDLSGKEARAIFGTLEDALFAGEAMEPTVAQPTVEPISEPEDKVEETEKKEAESNGALQAELAAQAKSLRESAGTNDIERMINTSAAAILSGFEQSPPAVGTTGGEWSILVLARSGLGNQNLYNTYYNNVCQTLIDKKGVLHKVKYTEYSRVILGLTAIGKDVTNVAGYNLLSYLSDFNNVKKQGINGPIWALIALDSHAYKIPDNPEAKTQNTRQVMIDHILGREVDGGGWTLSGTKADPDMTAMALYALEPYQDQPDVKAACDRAFNVLSQVQVAQGDDAGGYATFGTNNSESTAQVVMALSAYGIDPEADSRFIKNGVSTVDALSQYYLADSPYGAGFMHIKPGGGDNGGAAAGVRDAMATDQGMEALISHQRVSENKTQIFDMTDIEIEPATVMGMYLNAEEGVFSSDKESKVKLTASIDSTGMPDVSAVTWSVENHTSEKTAEVDAEGNVTVHASTLSAADLAAMGMGDDASRATVTASVTVDHTHTLTTTYEIYQGMTPSGIQERIQNLPSPGAFKAADRDAVVFVSRAMAQLTPAEAAYLDKTLLTTAEKQKLAYCQAAVKNINQRVIQTYSDVDGSRVYPKTFTIYSDLPWYVALSVENLDEETVKKIESSLGNRENLLQVNDITLTNTLADDLTTAYHPVDPIKIQMEVPETSKSMLAGVKVNGYTIGDEVVAKTTNMTISVDRRYVTFETSDTGIFGYVSENKSMVTPGGSGGASIGTGSSAISDAGASGSFSSTRKSINTTGTSGKIVDHGLILGQSGIGMVDITGTGKLKTGTDTLTSFWYELGQKVKAGAAPFAIGLGTMAVLYSIGLLIAIEVRHRKKLKM